MQVWYFQVRLLVCVAPNMCLSIDPHHLHARVQPPNTVKVRIIPDVQNFMGQHPGSLRTGMKDTHIGFGYAQLVRTQCCGEVLAQTYFVDIGVAVGH